MKLLTFAHRGEAQAFLSNYTFTPVSFFFDGLLKSNDYYLLITGEGPHSAGEKTTAVLAKYNDEISEVYNIGVAGSLNSNLKLHEIIWVRTAYAHHAEKLEFKSFSSQNANAVNDCITAYTRVLDISEKTKLSHFANIVDRELWAIASSARLFKKPYNSLKIISDDFKNLNSDICSFVKEEAPLLSAKLLLEFQRSENQPLLKKDKTKEMTFLNDPAFYFTTSQERKLLSLIDGLSLKGLSQSTLFEAPEVQSIIELDKLPKERTRLLLQYLNERLNPISIKIKEAIEKSLSPLVDAKISSNYDPDLEEDWLSLNIKIQSSRDLEKIKNALKIFSYEDFKKVLDGKFDV